MKNAIKELLDKTPSLPVLFIGSGFTRRYLNLPDWEGLLKKFCIKPNVEYSYYHDKAKRESRGSRELLFPKIADYIEDDFNEIWYTSDNYAGSREQHKEDIEAKISPFKLSLADYFNSATLKYADEYKNEIPKLKEIGNKNISCVITTNYDLFLEHCFGEDRFKTYIGQNELLFSTTYELAEIYKIHGCCSKPDSIIINGYDYEQYIKKNAYLSSKILTMFLENPIVFVGYSISDPNIRRILQSISDCLENEQLLQLKERLIFIEWNKTQIMNDNVSEKQVDFNNGKTITMKNVLLTNYADLYDAILDNHVKYEVKALRRIKSQLYDLVKQNKPTEKLYYTTSIEDNENEEVDFVIGVGVYGKFGRVGYRGIKSNELYLYTLGRSELNYDVDMLLKEVIPMLFHGRGTLPVCQLISKSSSKDCINNRVLRSFKRNFRDILSQGERRLIRNNGNKHIRDILEYYRRFGLASTLYIIPQIEPANINTDNLIEFLLQALNDSPNLLSIDNKPHTSRSQFKKCISIYDWLKYSQKARDRLDEFELNI